MNLNLSLVNGWKEYHGKKGRELLVPGSRIYQKDLGEHHLTAIVSKEPSGWHLSISHRHNLLDENGTAKPGRIPTWEEIKEARYALLPDQCYMAMILPPTAEFVNIHPTTMHLYEIPKELAQ